MLFSTFHLNRPALCTLVYRNNDMKGAWCPGEDPINCFTWRLTPSFHRGHAHHCAFVRHKELEQRHEEPRHSHHCSLHQRSQSWIALWAGSGRPKKQTNILSNNLNRVLLIENLLATQKMGAGTSKSLWQGKGFATHPNCLGKLPIARWSCASNRNSPCGSLNQVSHQVNLFFFRKTI